jgi:glycosyltransferase involved in cell wall biosynthesis
MSKIDISVVIPAYNEENFIGKCLKSVKNQKTNLNYEIIVVDNNSKDKTREIAKKHKVIVLKEKTQGVGAARRTGTEHAKGEIVVHIDADTVLYPDHLERVYEHFQKDKNLVCLGGIFLFYDAPLWKNILRKIMYKPLLFFAKTMSKGALGPSGNNMAFRNNSYKKTKGFNKNLKFGEDIEICRELKKLGKIKTNSKLKIQVSSRRYQLDKKFLTYTKNFIFSCLGKKPYKNTLPELKQQKKG